MHKRGGGMGKETVLSILKRIENILIETRGPINKPPFENKRLIQNLDGSFTDKQLPLIWAKEDLPAKMTPIAAIEACKKLGEGWRPCTNEEWLSIIDYKKHNPAIIPEAEILGLKTDDWYVSNTPFAGGSDCAWCVDLRYGSVDYCGKGYNSYVRPVRSSQ
jgi:hypothetical protein